MARHNTAQQRLLSVSDAIVRSGGKSETPLILLDTLTVNSATYATANSAIIPCHLYSTVTVLLTMRTWLTGDTLKLRPELNYQDMQEVLTSRYTDAAWKANFSDDTFHVPLERTAVGGGSPTGVPLEIYVPFVTNKKQFVVSFLTRGARFFRVGYAKDGSDMVVSAHACLHTGSWIGWA